MPNYSVHPLRKIYVSIFAGAILGTTSMGVHASEKSTELFIGGTGAALCTMQKLADEFKKTHPDTQIKVFPSLGSGGGIKALIAGSLTVSVSSRPLTEAELSKGILSQEISKTPLVLVANAKTPVSSVTLDQLAAIYAGTTKSWSDGTTVRPVLRPTGDVDTDIVRKMSAALDLAVQSAHQREGKNIAITDGDSANELERLPGSIGTSTLALVSCEERQLKLLPVDGVEPSKQNAVNGKYPYMKSIHLVTHQNPSPLTQKFVNFVNSSTGSALLAKNGNIATASSK